MKNSFRNYNKIYLKVLLDGNKKRKVNDFNYLLIELNKLVKSISILFPENSNIKSSIGKGYLTHTPWISIFEKNNYGLTIIFYPLLNGYSINICQKTADFFNSKEGVLELKNNRIKMEKYLKPLMKKIGWKNNYPEFFYDNNKGVITRGESYLISSPVCKFVKNNDNALDIEKTFNDIKTLFYYLSEYQELSIVNPTLGDLNLIKKDKRNYLEVINKYFKFYHNYFSNNNIVKDIIVGDGYFNNRSTVDRNKNKKIQLIKTELGDDAEKKVVIYEKRNLLLKNRADLAQKVKQKDTDGDGYDVESYYPNGKIKKIEVKSSLNDNKTIYISKREWEMFKNKETLIY
ncbi:hypothetical protein SGLAD_v1c04140 [Spiroplasma gladiatoris]|uniref:Protein NO VEIN C-terminal domain-containing protein n=1 Tax=Spiroplasma gladiatoris TaxID=2143 RepID=A0A4P7AIR3_9MOLU|nr:DUF3883 domain-containing protein [Spiroplasma gladiatoris]QBQ07613.1 hypothetical protein SGLAD_v1c04140 [Spiroplasma gladiatoris]